ncbi:MAG: hypothetical protein ACK5L5_04195 [Bacteroidales bacterium]
MDIRLARGCSTTISRVLQRRTPVGNCRHVCGAGALPAQRKQETTVRVS